MGNGEQGAGGQGGIIEQVSPLSPSSLSTLSLSPCPMANDYFVFLILFNYEPQISKAFANLYYLI
ncbi:hypothetical protein A6769_24860 [Nostoc punctiforme NIES-2108]|uniref:Uncharacterized protein n=1 Tax=Nostoc punctiforme NIES-2108 TaxID=1356359 RepID=A0A367RAW5_NOSPU|nr:hypothetical protein A6769_24860 [Nostoc punctiforme NIES-2108]